MTQLSALERHKSLGACSNFPVWVVGAAAGQRPGYRLIPLDSGTLGH
jgi:hypothetical protein